jgi:osmotically-inducible protein OsmY
MRDESQFLKNDVEQELTWEPRLNASEIGVAVKDGVVELTGFVDTYAAKVAAERAAMRVANIKALANEIRVKVPASGERTDEEIARTAVNALNSYGSVFDGIKVEVDDGWITLRGAVEWQYQKRDAERAVRNISGVKGITDEIALKPTAIPADIKARIEEALKRNAAVHERRIAVEAHEGKVTLRGSVRTFAERMEAEEAAWAAPGVSRVEDLITVG